MAIEFPDIETIVDYLEGSAPGSFTTCMDPLVRLQVNPARRKLSIRTEASGPEVDVQAYRHLSFETLLEADRPIHQVSVIVPDGALDQTYAWVRGLIRLIVEEGLHAGEALLRSIDALDALLARDRYLTIERQLGLVGELLTLEAAVRWIGSEPAIDSWFGPDDEEHDFRFGDFDVEVKTTQRERREHWISSSSQLQASDDRPLVLLSYQVTAAPTGVGRSLPEAVGICRSLLDDTAMARFDRALDVLGYRDEDRASYRRRWSYRAPPEFFEVDETFPAVTPAVLEAAFEDAHRVRAFRYLLDLSGLATADVGLPTVDIDENGAVDG